VFGEVFSFLFLFWAAREAQRALAAAIQAACSSLVVGTARAAADGAGSVEGMDIMDSMDIMDGGVWAG
jgi:hypothetical protein